MEKITRLDNNRTLDTLKTLLNDAVKAVAQQHNLNIKVGHITYWPNRANFTLEVRVVGEDGNVYTQEAEDFKRYAYQHNVPTEYLGVEFTFKNKRYRLVGMNPGSRRYPFVTVEASTGERINFAAQTVRDALRDGLVPDSKPVPKTDEFGLEFSP